MENLEAPDVPETAPQLFAPETWLIPNLVPADEGLYLGVNSMVIRGAEPVIVDTGAPIHRDLWREKVFSIVEPEDVRWIFLSHDDGDHTGGLLDAMEMCPNATLVTNFFSFERLALEKPALPPQRMRWIDPGGQLRRRRPHPAPVQAADFRRTDDPWALRPDDRCHVDRRLVRLPDDRRRLPRGRPAP